MIEAFGWLGGVFLGICGVPQAWQSWKQGHTIGINDWFLLLWGSGEILTFTYVVSNKDWPLVMNYGFNLLILIPIVWYRFRPRVSVSS